jgi:DNA-binding transcriptional regulator YiaG
MDTNILNKIKKKINNNYTINPKTNCWEWVGCLNYYGYANNFVVQGKIYSPHRMSFLIYKGNIPEGFCIDHLCRNRKCINPDHLEAITWAKNTKRGWSGPYRTRKPKGSYPKEHPIKKIREDLNMTQACFEQICGFKPSFISQVERGFRGLSEREASKICDALEMPEILEEILIIN